eukprot:gnl/TRDRNA2_/TRDRNA2_187024_c0_seq1.p1 gnl/TRDRNA2_/TRDRNA2_187024_c0~~gnl/TRDRNA2_/TRDRNA2_187024_c0_seq1.p1  ORF type:complete len:263 (-),score=70.87 gnl/TRDRNA2_/TRDRNA2_187024_c0_seq1:111-899(-)
MMQLLGICFCLFCAVHSESVQGAACGFDSQETCRKLTDEAALVQKDMTIQRLQQAAKSNQPTVDTDKDGKISTKEANAYDINSANADSDNILTEKELTDGIMYMWGGKMSKDGPKETAKTLIQSYDEDRNGKLELKEALKDPVKFHSNMKQMVNDNVLFQAESIVKDIDTNGDGSVTKEEVSAGVKKSTGYAMGDQERDEMFKQSLALEHDTPVVDKNANGILEKEEIAGQPLAFMEHYQSALRQAPVHFSVAPAVADQGRH